MKSYLQCGERLAERERERERGEGEGEKETEEDYELVFVIAYARYISITFMYNA